MNHEKAVNQHIVVFFVLTASARAGVLEIVITEGMDTARPIAVVPFKWLGDGPAPGNLTDVIAADLTRSGKFNPIPQSAMPQQPANDGELDYSAWAKLGVEAVLMGTIEPYSVDRYMVKFQLVDVCADKSPANAQMLRDGQLVKSRCILDARSSVIDGDQFRQYSPYF